MDQYNTGTPGLLSAGASIYLAGISWVTLQDAQPFISLIAGIVSIVAGCFAIRYYYIKSKK